MSDTIFLKYLFEAELKNGSVFKQNPEDESYLRPKTQNEDGTFSGGSSFTDIFDDVETLQIKRFHLVEQKVFGHKDRWTVDLMDGHYEHNGQHFWIPAEEQLPIDNPEFKLIYYKTRTQHMNVQMKTATGEIVSVTPIGEDPIMFTIGWQTNIEGKNYQSRLLVI